MRGTHFTGNDIYVLMFYTDWYDNNRRILLCEVKEGWAWDGVQSNAQRVYDLAMSANYPVGLIVVLPRTMSIPPGGFVQNSRRVIENHQQLGIHTIVYVTRIAYTITLWRETIDSLAEDPSRYFFAGTVEEAEQIVRSRS